MKPSIAIIGCGKVGTNLGRTLFGKGYPVAALVSKTAASAKRTADIIGTDRLFEASEVSGAAVRQADVCFITTPDDVIQDVCDRISRNGNFKKGAVVLHCSGFCESTILASAKICAAHIGSVHPMQSIASVVCNKNPFENSVMTFEGEDRADQTARQIVADLNAQFVRIATKGKVHYHTAAVVVSNYLVTLIDLAYRLIEKAGIPPDKAFEILKPLIAGTLDNIEKAGTAAALTGPISRGDVDTVDGHINAIAADMSEATALYKTLGRYTLELAESSKTLSDRSARELAKRFEDSR